MDQSEDIQEKTSIQEETRGNENCYSFHTSLQFKNKIRVSKTSLTDRVGIASLPREEGYELYVYDDHGDEISDFGKLFRSEKKCLNKHLKLIDNFKRSYLRNKIYIGNK
jgi:hypothetical protein